MNKTRRLGKNGPELHALGYGAMGLEGYYGASDERRAIETLRQAIELGMMIDTADAYGNGHNESLIARAIAEGGKRPYIATKFGIVFDKQERWSERPTGWKFSLRLNGSADYAQRCLDASLERLGVNCIDLWYAHYVDPGTPLEETVGAMAKAVKAGKVRQLGLSNVTAEELRRAHAVHPISAVQYEYSLWRREAEEQLLPAARELGVTLVAWGPLGSGFLSGKVDEVAKGDFRLNNPRFRGENFTTNRDRFAPLLNLAESLGVSAAQLSLAWLLHQDGVVPIPGTRSSERLLENAKSAEIELDAATLERLDQIAPSGLAVGDTLV